FEHTARHSLEFRREDAGVGARQRRRHSGGILEAVTHGYALDCGEFGEARRLAGADIVKLNLAGEPLPQRGHGFEHQRWILEIVETPGEDHPEWPLPAWKRLRLEDLGIHPRPQRVDLGLVLRIGLTQPLGDMWINA